MLSTIHVTGKALVNISVSAVHFREVGQLEWVQRRESDWQLGNMTYKK